jgi:hypothetical protein
MLLAVAAAAEPISDCRAEATGLLIANRSILDALVDALIKRGILDGDEICTIIAATIAMRTAEAERQRRPKWKAREASGQSSSGDYLP